MSDTTDKSEWVDAKTLAREIHVSARTVLRLCARGEIPAARVGRQWRIRRVDWERYLARTRA